MIFDDHWDAQFLAQGLCDQAAGSVLPATSWPVHDPFDGATWEGLGLGAGAKTYREGGEKSCEISKRHGLCSTGFYSWLADSVGVSAVRRGLVTIPDSGGWRSRENSRSSEEGQHILLRDHCSSTWSLPLKAAGRCALRVGRRRPRKIFAPVLGYLYTPQPKMKSSTRRMNEVLASISPVSGFLNM